jgi:hypothetical protein
MAEYLAGIAREKATPEERSAMTERNLAYVRENLCAELSEEDIARADAFAEAAIAGTIGEVA